MEDTSNEAKALAQQEILLDSLRRNGVDAASDLYQETVRVTDEAVRIAREADVVQKRIDDAADNAKDLASALKDAASAMASLLNMGSLDVKLAGLVAEVRAIETGANRSAAGYVASESVKAAQDRDVALAAGVLPQTFVNQAYFDRIDKINRIGEETAKRDAALAAQRESERGARDDGSSGKGSRSNVVDINEILNKRREQIEQERVLIGLTGQRRKEEELYFEIMNQIAPEQKAAASDFVRGEAQKLVALQQTNDALQAQRDMQEQVSQLLESSMEKAFMSIVDGTSSVKYEFKAIASDIIKELYRVLVVQRLVGSAKAGTGIAGFISGLIGNANGNAFSNGNVVPFANGGVVGSPTTFPMAGGKTGLMGEAGPEAIMPLKRGKDGKLGVAADGGGTVVVNNHFNISANGDDSVKRIVRQQIPQIAEATKAAVVDAKRRGGSYGRAFG
jgi:hypothetical protein